MKTFINIVTACALVLLQGVALAQTTEVTYYIPDALGSPVAAMDEQGNIKWRKHYKPYGEEIEQDEASKDNHIGYTGHAHDRNTGLTYMGARYYDPAIGRFMGMDPADVKPGDPRTFNRYAYSNNNPYKFFDPDGRESISLDYFNILGFGIGLNTSNYGDGIGKAELLFRFGTGTGAGGGFDQYGEVSSHAQRGDKYIARMIFSAEQTVAFSGQGFSAGQTLYSGNAFNPEDNNVGLKRKNESMFIVNPDGVTKLQRTYKAAVELGFTWDTEISTPEKDISKQNYNDINMAP